MERIITQRRPHPNLNKKLNKSNLAFRFLFLFFIHCYSHSHLSSLPVNRDKEHVTTTTTTYQNYGLKIHRTLPHPKPNFTQGLLYHQGYLYESTGVYGESALKKIDANSGKVVSMEKLPNEFFGEGIAFDKTIDNIFMLTWKSKQGFVYRLPQQSTTSFQLIRRFNYPGEGWGLTLAEDSFLLSDGSFSIHRHSLTNFKRLSSFSVKWKKGAIEGLVPYLNELEYVDGFLYANVFGRNYILQIQVTNGNVIGVIDCRKLVAENSRFNRDGNGVLNGIAYDHHTKHFYITGKRWRFIYEVSLIKY